MIVDNRIKSHLCVHASLYVKIHKIYKDRLFRNGSLYKCGQFVSFKHALFTIAYLNLPGSSSLYPVGVDFPSSNFKVGLYEFRKSIYITDFLFIYTSEYISYGHICHNSIRSIY